MLMSGALAVDSGVSKGSEVSCDVGEAPPKTTQLTGSIETPYSRPASSSHIHR